ncbi:drug resistance transporter, EmrB/QacA subfamily [Singulisphaera sp. GP187]|uniref:MFS transporter n=1 Tax=Singulisphaera sp. GP187 TaxID=1882752 RepID=UPI000927E246|nr:MFS transporter [Singulisphaera sp. GP187]SIN81472.1 drug resistance transporter, EmrB/QacA subfamily [Singulisphaera sp. GP187]
MSVEENEATMPGRAMVTLALLLAMAVAALEQTVVSTAMPSIIAQLKGLDIYPWVFSAYLLAATVSTPIYGKLADIFGRKRILLFGLGLFALGSMLSGMAQSMPGLIAMRVIQGLGAGALGPIVLTMLGDLFTLQERAKVQGLFSAVWGGSSLIGPALGGILTDQLSWRWVFFVTVPFGLISAWILMRYVHETVERKSVAPIDWGGATLLAIGSFLLLMGVLGGSEISRSGTIGLLAMSAVMLALFVRQERVAVDPVLPLDLVLSPHIGSAIVGSFLIGALLFGIDTYIPLFMQGVRGGSATSAGKMITPLFLSWSISVAVAAKVVVRLGFRRTAVVGSLLIATGVLGLVVGAARPADSGPFFLAGMVIIGMGMGPASLSYILSVQSEVKWGRRGVATGAVTFFRTMGGALGVGVLGATLGLMLAHRLAASNAVGIDIAAALRPETHKLLTAPQLAAVQDALGRSLRDVFLQMFAMAVLACLCSFGLRGGRAVAQGNKSSDESNLENVELAVGIEH